MFIDVAGFPQKLAGKRLFAKHRKFISRFSPKLAEKRLGYTLGYTLWYTLGYTLM